MSWRQLPALIVIAAIAHAAAAPVPAGATIGVYNVVFYGAKGDGVTDDRAAIQAAITAACARTSPLYNAAIYFPPAPGGAWMVGVSAANSPFSLNVTCSNLRFQGVSGVSVIKQLPNMPCGSPCQFHQLFRLIGVNGITFSHLILDGNWGNAVGQVSAASDGQVLTGAGDTIALANANLFPSSGGPFTIMARPGAAYVTCSGANATQLTGCTGAAGTVLFQGMVVGYVDANFGINQTTQGTGLTAVTAPSDGATLPTSTINVGSTTGWTFALGLITVSVQTTVGYQRLVCTGSTSTTVTGCSCLVSGECLGTLHTGFQIAPTGQIQGRNDAIAVGGVDDLTLDDVVMRDIYGDCLGLAQNGSTYTTRVTVRNSSCYIASRDAIAIQQGTQDLWIDNFDAYSIEAQAVDSEPVGSPVPNVTVKNSRLRGWWQNALVPSGPMSIAGGSTAFQVFSQDASTWRVRNNFLNGGILEGNSTDVVVEGNRIVEDYTVTQTPTPIYVGGGNRDVIVTNNYAYSRAPSSGIEGDNDCCIFAAVRAGSAPVGNAHADPLDLHMYGNQAHAKAGRFGFDFVSIGGNALASSGTATTVTATSVVDTSATWTADQWSGSVVYIGDVQAVVQTNTACPGSAGACTLSLYLAFIGTSWMTSFDERAPTPSAGAYQLQNLTGVADVFDNTAESRNDGNGSGVACFTISAFNSAGSDSLIREHHNNAFDCKSFAFIYENSVTFTQKFIDIEDNFAHDDQATHTTTDAVGITNPPAYKKLILRGTVQGQNVTNALAGEGSQWLEIDGPAQSWAGIGSPASVVNAPAGALYYNLSGGSTNTLFVNESGGTGGWVAK